MPSRKRSKGRERKARQNESNLSRPQKTLKEWLTWGERNKKINCNHGCVATTATRCEQFLESFFSGMAHGVELLDNMTILLTTFPDVFTEGESHQNAVTTLSCLATNMMLFASEYGNKALSVSSLGPAIDDKVDLEFKADSLSSLCLNITTTLCILVHFESGQDIEHTFYQPKVAGKLMSFNPQTSGRRGVLKLLSRLNPCSCLKELYTETKKMHEKLCYCSHCKSIKKRSSLMVCGDCRIENYCSKECQTAAWSDHQSECKRIIDFQKPEV